MLHTIITAMAVLIYTLIFILIIKVLAKTRIVEALINRVIYEIENPKKEEKTKK